MIQSEQIVFADTFAYHVYSGRGEGKKKVTFSLHKPC